MVGASPEASCLKLWASGVPLVSVLVEPLQTRCKKACCRLCTLVQQSEGGPNAIHSTIQCVVGQAYSLRVEHSTPKRSRQKERAHCPWACCNFHYTKPLAQSTFQSHTLREAVRQ